MAILDTVNEESTAVVTVSFENESEVAVTPDQAWYSLYCETNSTEILAETELTGLGTTKDITITAAQNAIIDTTVEFEIKILTVRFLYATSTKQGTNQYRYKVMNLTRIS